MTSKVEIEPGMKPPGGVEPNFIDPPTQQRLIIAVAVLAISLSTIFVSLRVYTRRFVNRRLWWDDC